MTLAEGEDSYMRVVDFCAESIARARRAESEGGQLAKHQSRRRGPGVAEASTRHNEKPHHPNTIARPHQH